MVFGSIDLTFNSGGTGFNGEVLAAVLQPNGKVILGGLFTNYNDGTNHSCGYIARLNPDGTFDSSFAPGPGFDGSVTTIVLQSDGKVLVGGLFDNYDDGANYSCGRIARLNANGKFDTSFMNGPGTGIGGIGFGVTSLVLNPDGSVIIAGSFTSYNDGVGHPCGNIAKINPLGIFDVNFVNGLGTGFDSIILSLSLQKNGQVIVGGYFAQYYDGIIFHDCGRVARLNADGAFDTNFLNGPGTGFKWPSFPPAANVSALAVQSDGKVLVGGFFEAYFDGVSRVCRSIARLNVDGTLDTTFLNGPGTGFDPFADATLYSFSLQPDGKIIVGGTFANYNDGRLYDTGSILRLNVDGTLDTTFLNGPGTGFTIAFLPPTGFLYSTILQPDGKVFVGGLFSSYSDGTNTYQLGNITRLIAYSVPPAGENFGIRSLEDLFASQNIASFILPVSQVPGVIIGSVSVNLSGDILVRKPDGSVGLIS